MKLLVRKLWFPYSVDKTLSALFRIPQMREQFDEGFQYDGEMRPKGLKIFSGFWPADAILDKLPKSEKDVYLVLTSLDLKGDYGRINGKGYGRRAISSNNSFLSGYRNNIFDPQDIDFQTMTFHEIGHALGLLHHDQNPRDPCAMPHDHDYEWTSLLDIRLCNDCYRKIR